MTSRRCPSSLVVSAIWFVLWILQTGVVIEATLKSAPTSIDRSSNARSEGPEDGRSWTTSGKDGAQDSGGKGNVEVELLRGTREFVHGDRQGPSISGEAESPHEAGQQSAVLATSLAKACLNDECAAPKTPASATSPGGQAAGLTNEYSKLRQQVEELEEVVALQRKALLELSSLLQVQQELAHKLQGLVKRGASAVGATVAEGRAEARLVHKRKDVGSSEGAPKMEAVASAGLSYAPPVRHVGMGKGEGGQWDERFDLLAAVSVAAEVSALQTLPPESPDGISRYVLVGDGDGKLHVFRPRGDLILTYQTASTAAVTSILPIAIRRNDTWLVTGHADGAVLVQQLSDPTAVTDGAARETGRVTITFLRALVPSVSAYGGDQAEDERQESQRKRIKELEGQDSSFDDPNGEELGAVVEQHPFASLHSGPSAGPPITTLELYRSGNSRYILVADVAGRIRVFRSNGSLYGESYSAHRPLAFLRTPSSQRLLFLTETGAASLDLKSMQVRTSECIGMNGSTVGAYGFDSSGRSKAYGVTTDGELLHVALTGDTFDFDCHVRQRELLGTEKGGAAPCALKGYVLMASLGSLDVWNVTTKMGLFSSSPTSSTVRPVTSLSLDEFGASFSKGLQEPRLWPLMTCNRERLVVLAFSEGVVGIFSSTMPVPKAPPLNVRTWSSPIVIALVIIIGAWQFLANRKVGPSSGTLIPIDAHSAMATGLAPSGFQSPSPSHYKGLPRLRERSFNERTIDPQPSRQSSKDFRSGVESQTAERGGGASNSSGAAAERSQLGAVAERSLSFREGRSEIRYATGGRPEYASRGSTPGYQRLESESRSFRGEGRTDARAPSRSESLELPGSGVVSPAAESDVEGNSTGPNTGGSRVSSSGNLQRVGLNFSTYAGQKSKLNERQAD
eukprot:TRINITY_DN5087_c0_g3_i2.p1 TRINITY_DN5087_c0_g3~~TRINITY_DN5087_c0_g3_i2.p1  ORF type:complete len:908 (+),score=147.82 TRINITY_DN5087_c0_g3_i2:455-3178(+)